MKKFLTLSVLAALLIAFSSTLTLAADRKRDRKRDQSCSLTAKAVRGKATCNGTQQRDRIRAKDGTCKVAAATCDGTQQRDRKRDRISR